MASITSDVFIGHIYITGSVQHLHLEVSASSPQSTTTCSQLMLTLFPSSLSIHLLHNTRSTWLPLPLAVILELASMVVIPGAQAPERQLKFRYLLCSGLRPRPLIPRILRPRIPSQRALRTRTRQRKTQGKQPHWQPHPHRHRNHGTPLSSTLQPMV